MNLMEENKFYKNSLQLLVFLITFIPLIIFNGWALSLIYKWWIYPIIDVNLKWIDFIGINCLIGFINRFVSAEDFKNKNVIEILLIKITTTLLFLGINYITYIILGG